MSYLIAAYVVTITSLAGYGFCLWRERNSLSKGPKSNSG
jgi:hypothetical protein